jgi:drug/metabolite transporter (DMT)-like permease
VTARVALPSRTGAILCMVGSAACWGLATVMTKDVLSDLPPFTTLALQLSASVTVLWLAVALSGQRIPAGGGRAALSGLLEPGLAYGVGVPGLALTSAAAASVISASEPAVVILVAALFLRSRPGAAAILAVIVAMAGVVLITAGAAETGGTRSFLGDALIFAGVAFAALYVLSSSHLVQHIPPLALSALQQTAGLGAALLFLATALGTGWEVLPSPPATVVVAAMASGVVQYAAAFWLYLRGMQVLPVQTAALFLTLTPVFGVAGAVAFLGESVTALQAMGSLLVLAALVGLARRG